MKIKFIALALCLLLVADMCVSFERSSRHHRRYHQAKAKTTTQLAFTNKWAKLAEGVMTGLTNGQTAWYECLPKEWTTEVADPQENLLNQRFEAMGTVGKVFLTVLDKAADLLCKFRAQVVRIFELFFDPSSAGFLEGKFTIRRRFRTRRDFFKWLGNQVSTAVNWTKNVATKVADWTKAKATEALNWTKETLNKIWGAISAPVQSFLNDVREAITKIQSALHSIFSIIKQIQKIINCIKSLKSAGQEVLKVINGLQTKWNWLVATATGTGGILTIPIIANIVIGIICQKNVFKKVIEDFLQANATKDNLQKFFLRGRAIGTIIHTLGTATRRRKY